MKNDPYIKEAANKAGNHSVRCSFFFACPHCAVRCPNRRMKEIEKEEEIPPGSHGLRRNRRVILQLWEVRAIMSTENRNHPIQTKEAQIMDRTRLDDMLARYGEVCTQKVAAQLLNVVPRTIKQFEYLFLLLLQGVLLFCHLLHELLQLPGEPVLQGLSGVFHVQLSSVLS